MNKATTIFTQDGLQKHGKLPPLKVETKSSPVPLQPSVSFKL